MKTQYCALAGLFLLSGCASAPPVGEADAIGDVVRGMGYTELRRPMDVWMPGAIIAVTSAAPFDGKRVCSSDGALGSEFRPEISDTLSSSWKRKTDRGFSLGAQAMQAINTKIGYKAVKDITVTLSDAIVYEMSDEKLIAAARSNMTSEDCKAAIAMRFGRGEPMTMISASLEANVVYAIAYENGVDASLKYAHAQQIAAELAGHLKTEGVDKVAGQHLILGIMDDRQHLTTWAQLTPGLPQLAASGVVEPGARRLIPASLILNGREGSDDEEID
jgi:hypothetical protein